MYEQAKVDLLAGPAPIFIYRLHLILRVQEHQVFYTDNLES